MSLLFRIKDKLLLIVIGMYLLFNSGFMQIRFPAVAGGGIPIGEIVLLLALISIDYKNLIPLLSRAIFLLPFLIWWGYGLSRMLYDSFEHGMWAFRDGTHIIESLYLVVGFSIASKQKYLQGLIQWLPKLLLIICIYALGYPFGDVLRNWSPKITAAAGYDSPLFFFFSNTGGLLLWASAYLVIFRSRNQKFEHLYLIVAGFLIIFPVLLFQARTIYMQILCIIAFLFVYRRIPLHKVIIGACIALGLLAILSVSGIQITGRLEKSLSLEFFYNHFMSIFGIEAAGIYGAAGGVYQRLGWWLELYKQWTADIWTWIYGLGFGIPLVNWGSSQGVPVREPHNSIVSVVARIGAMGIFAFGWMHISLLRIWKRTYKICNGMNWHQGKNLLLFLMVFFILVWVLSIGEDALEKPFWAIPYYFIWGYVLALYNQLRYGWQPDALDERISRLDSMTRLHENTSCP